MSTILLTLSCTHQPHRSEYQTRGCGFEPWAGHVLCSYISPPLIFIKVPVTFTEIVCASYSMFAWSTIKLTDPRYCRWLEHTKLVCSSSVTGNVPTLNQSKEHWLLQRTWPIWNQCASPTVLGRTYVTGIN